jgi:hypothetical protein
LINISFLDKQHIIYFAKSFCCLQDKFREQPRKSKGKRHCVDYAAKGVATAATAGASRSP